MELKATKFPAWLWPLTFGLAVAYLVASFIPLPKPTAPILGKGFSTDAADKISKDSKLILERNILGLDNPAEIQKKATVTPTTWNLVGIITGKSDMAVFRIKSETVILREGEEYEGWTLYEIKPRYVIWKYGREEKRIAMWDQVQSLKLVRGKTNKIIVERAQASEVLEDPNAFLNQALFKPNSKNGKTQGFRVTNIKTNSLLKKLGLENGDVLMRVNGEMITGPTKLLQIYGSLSGASAIYIDVERKGQMLSLVVELK
ncbi:type II secretion pathway component PulC-like protein [Maridesulfovibrio hydrothermalis]|uniref:Type II secretory pathway component PulC-like protein n=1 Tax=Maridesulfovibrio hydrothermalis AM13 = DSM 14728 TaxID=1121451 RepID=L0RAL0_9BACT|nr:type II secretion pathway component PulC-like protein [Maridesulfovibrio hydrothermalis]CCO23252.1 Type II secretory pathway component PulC-like protein [Maridesulfovibrio hydrothermalis AM13 = DSM 14728]